MCRYGFKTYKPHYICFTCRKSFKQSTIEDNIIQNGDWDMYRRAYLYYNNNRSKQFRKDNPELIKRFETQYRNKEYKCPECGSKMNNIGLDFKAPRKNKIKEWEIIKSMYTLGNSFHSCGCDGPGYIPKTKQDYRDHLNTMELEFKKRLSK